jgi:hypothetical protein
MNTPITRGGWLAAFLIVSLVQTAISTILYFVIWNTLIITMPLWAAWTFPIMICMRLMSLVAIWFWSRSGVLAYTLLTLSGMILCLVIGTKMSFLGIVGIGVLILLIKPKWRYMTWGVSLSANLPETNGQDV